MIYPMNLKGYREFCKNTVAPDRTAKVYRALCYFKHMAWVARYSNAAWVFLQEQRSMLPAGEEP